MIRAILLLAVLLAGCARPAPLPVGSHRDPSVPIGSIALFEQSRLDGDWREMAGYALGAAVPGSYRIWSNGTMIAGPGRYLPITGAEALRPAGPGRMQVSQSRLWVLWVDADYRTLVLGTPDGTVGAVLNRGGAIAPDRLDAARRVLDFNGYDLAGLEIAQ